MSPKSRFRRKATIRTRTLMGISLMMLPVLLLGALSLCSVWVMNETLGEVVEESFEEGRPLQNLLKALGEADIEAHDFLLYGTALELSEYQLAADETMRAFEAALAAPFGEERERELVRSSYIAWKLAHNLILQSDIERDPGFRLKHMRTIDIQYRNAKKELDEALNLAAREMHEEVGFAATIWKAALWGVIALLVASVVVASSVWFWLVNSVARPLEELGAMVRAVGSGEARMPPPMGPDGGRDEIGMLHRAVHDMSERVFASTTALKELADRDELTGLYNHRSFHRMMEEETERCRRYRRPFSLLLMDLDNFKYINDTFGHQAGDSAIRQSAAIVKESIRAVDRAARYGGDEIAVILPETTLEAAIAVAERLRVAVGMQQVGLPGGVTASVGVSIGAAEYGCEGGETAQGVISAADKALYDAKRGGRNRVVAAQKHPAE